MLAKDTKIVSVIGGRTGTQLTESVAALNVQPSRADVTGIEEAISPSSVAGTRYEEHHMRMLDSER